jgi:putative hemolysin
LLQHHLFLLTHSTDFLLNVLQIKPTADGKVTEEEIKAIIEGTEGEVQEIEQDIVERVFHIEKINSLMTHRKSVFFFTIAFRSRASKGIYAQRIALNLSRLW